MAIINEIKEEEQHQEESKIYDVFLSFRGIDTRNNFTDYLCEALVNDNITTFLDEQVVEAGEELKPELTRAIKGSRASIIVLSKNYASSSWCLDELLLILEQKRKSSKYIVVPIFYHVEPTHVRKQEGSYGEALLEHRQRMEAEKDEEKKRQAARKLESWTEALKEVADLKGKDVHGRIEKEFIEEIVKEINSRLDIHMKTEIPHLIGRDRFLDTIRFWFKGGSSDTTEILTIWGMAGIGKTSLAKHIFMMYRHKFERSSFVVDIERRGQQSSGLLLLQNKLLGDLLKRRMIEEDDVQNCTSKIETALLKRRTLVVLDGVDNFEQVHVLVGREGFHPGSRIIITTKDGSITDKALLHINNPPKHTKLALNELRSQDSLKLFCWHAFGGYSPKEGYEVDAIRASEYCKGHPLALKVLGSFLFNEDADTWSHTFTMLESREFQNNHVHNVLRIGFDSLPSDCKELFKHIACFFVGKETEVTEAILKDCGIHTSYGMKKLIGRCLLAIGVGGELKMHQLLQGIGRDLVYQESPHKPWKRSRVWNHEESLNILQEDKGTAKIQGLFFDTKMLKKESLCGSSSALDHEFQDNDLNMHFGAAPSFSRLLEFSSSCCRKIEFSTNALNKMDKLMLLQLNHVKLNGPFTNFPKGLRGLCMHGFQSEYIPSDLPMEHLVALDMSFSDLKQLWRRPKFLRSLKYLNLSYSKLVTIGGFEELPVLERLILTRCESLTHVCESICECDSKELFKHIACFFVGKEIEVTEAILNDCGVHPSHGIKKLIERCFLTIGLEKELKMHRLLQDMGRDIVHKESLHEPWNRSRVWNHEESLNILQDDKGTAKIQGLLFDMKMLRKESSLFGSSSLIDHEFEDIDLTMNFRVGPSFSKHLELSSSHSRKVELSTNALNRMEKLILLQLSHVKLNGPFNNFPKGLRGLCMHGFQSEYIPSDLPMEHLVALDMSFSDLKQLWRKPKFLGSLKYLNLSYSKLVTIGGFKELPALERLILTRCESLTHVCESIGECGGLLLLNLSYCSELKNLSIIIRKLKTVKVITLDGCGAGVFYKERKRMKLMDDVSKKLQAIFSCITRLVPNSPKSISLSLPSSLVTLSLTNNNLSSESFPVDFSSMSMLKSLFLDDNPVDSIPDCLKSLSRLEVLSVGRCSMLKSILCPSSTIKRLYAEECDLLEKITLHQDMSAPPLICFDNSMSLTDIEGILKIQDLAQVDYKIICSLGWTDIIHYVKDYEVEIFNLLLDAKPKKLPLKMLYEFGIFSTCFLGEVPKWFDHRSNGSSISFTMPSSSTNKRIIKGVNICFVHTFSGDSLISSILIEVKNITKDRYWMYYGYMVALGYVDKDIIWLSHWMFGNNELEAGDGVSITIIDPEEEEEDGRVMVTECGVSLVYSDGDEESVDDPLSYYKSWKHIIGRDLSPFETTSGNYKLHNSLVCPNAYKFKRLFYSETRFKKSFDRIEI